MPDWLAQLAAENVHLVVQTAGKQMREYQKGGSIILMPSMGGVAGAYISLAYATSKGGIIQLMKSLADGFGPDGIQD